MFERFFKFGRILILAGLANSYFNYLYQYCFQYLIVRHMNVRDGVVFTVVHHILFSLVIWLYFLVVLKPHQPVNSSYMFDRKTRKLFKHHKKEDGLFTSKQRSSIQRLVQKRNLEIVTRNWNGEFSICLKCKLLRPDRCYHCIKCNRCILRRDHHCPWLQTCIGYSNHKYYCLFLMYFQVYFSFMFTTVLYSVVKNSDKIVESSDGFQQAYFKSSLIINSLMLIPIQLLLVNYWYMGARNMTNIEFKFPPRVNMSYRGLRMVENVFDLGSVGKNFEQIFGRNPILAILPVWTTPGDGHTFTKNLSNIDIV